MTEKYEKINKVSKVQLTCPKCKYEFSFNLGDIDTQIMTLGKDIQSIVRQIAEFKTLPVEEQKEKYYWKKQAMLALEKKKEQLKKLKIKSKAIHDEVTRMNYQLLKNVIKDFYGNEEFERCINEVIERGKAYKISETMKKDNYTHSKGTLVKKV